MIKSLEEFIDKSRRESSAFEITLNNNFGKVDLIIILEEIKKPKKNLDYIKKIFNIDFK